MQPQYPQGPRPAQNQPQYPQPGGQHPQPGMPPQYQGMPQVPYYPQPKKGMPTWAIVLIVVGVVFVFVIPIMAIAAIPLLTSNTRDARRAEGEQIMGSMKGITRITYARLGTHLNIQTLTGKVGSGGCGASPMELAGKYYSIDDRVLATQRSAKLTARPNIGNDDGNGYLEFDWVGGDGRYTWDP